MLIADKIEEYRKGFRCLSSWKIKYVTDEGLLDLVSFNSETKEASIYPPSNLEEVDMEEYIMHEILHIVFAEYRNSVDECFEDDTITDICQFIWPEKFDVQDIK